MISVETLLYLVALHNFNIFFQMLEMKNWSQRGLNP